MTDIEIPKRPIYMDHNATTPVDPRVLEVMIPYFSESFGNAASTDHHYGIESLQAVERARTHVADLIHANSEEIIFTSGATESNNLALIGVAEGLQTKGKHIITCVTEHPAVLDVCKYIEGRGWHVTYLPVDQYGRVDPDAVRLAIRSDTVLISIMTANNEIGTIAPISDIGRIAGERDVLFHTDATQAVGYVPMNVDAMGIDLLSMSAHKMYGPKGIGALFVRKRRPRIKIVEQMHGGGHERGMRSGTINVPGVVGFGAAANLVRIEGKTESARLAKLRNQMWQTLSSELASVRRNGSTNSCLPHTLNVTIEGVESRALILRLKNFVSFSTGAACSTSTVEPSHVIVAITGHGGGSFNTIRIGLGRLNTFEDVSYVSEAIVSACLAMRALIS